MQVCLDLTAENYQREQNGLLDAMNYFNFEKGYIITLDKKEKILVENKLIEVIPFYENWLDYLE